MNQNKRTDKRISWQKDCVLISKVDLIDAKIVNISKIGLGVKTDRTVPFNNGCELDVFIPSQIRSPAKVMWTKKDFNNTSRLGLKFSTSTID